jgi:hypothetical protein
VQGRRIIVSREYEAGEASKSHICFIAGRDEGFIGSLLERVKDKPVLTIGDSDRFLQLGGVIRFRQIDSRLRFEINQEAATRGGLRISARLLALGDRTRGAPQ